MVTRRRLGSGAADTGGPSAFQNVVLVVEDDPRLRAEMRDALEAAGFWVEVAVDFHRAVELLEARVVDAVCVDTTLPRESGFELCEWVRRSAAHARVPIVVTSDRATPEDMALAEEAGGNAFLKKPFDGARLVKYVEAVLEGPISGRKSVRSLSRLV